MTFREKLAATSKANDSLVCVGLDTDPSRIPSCLGSGTDAVIAFNSAIIDATQDAVCAYKPNSAFYEALGPAGIEALIATCEAVPDHIPVILDVKRGDIGNTADKYAVFAYDVAEADAVTVNPYMGFDAVKPFLRSGKCAFVLCMTSNASAVDFQVDNAGGISLYERVASAANVWNSSGEIGLVVGATQPGYLRRIREIAGSLPFLVPGVGAQGGSVGKVMGECGDEPGTIVINNSRGILYASSGADFAEAARKRCLDMKSQARPGKGE